jgi:uncharacterized membrane protein
MVYMSADNNLEDEAILNVNQMEEVGSSDDLNIVIMLDRHPEYDKTNGDWDGTRRYYVTEDDDPVNITSQLVLDMGEVDMGNADQLRDFVVWSISNYPADRYYLDVWGHGGGWRDGTCNDYSSGSVIETDELGTALGDARSLTNVTLDGVGFDQCLMAQLEVFYEIKAVADVMVGAATLIPADGYNYTRVFEPLALDPDMNGTRLAEILVTAFFDEYGYFNARAHSSVDAEELDARLSPAITRLAQLMRGKALTLHDEFKWARDFARTYSIIDYIDLGNFTERLLEVLPENETEIREAAQDVRDNVTTTVVAEDHGNDMEGSTGLSFYFPERAVAWYYAKTAISHEQRWDEFLDAYFDGQDRPNIPPSIGVDGPHPGSVVGLSFRVSGSASDVDGNITKVEYKFGRGPWRSFEAGDEWIGNVSTQGINPGLHRFSVRAQDDMGDYSPEVQFQLNVESRGIALEVDPEGRRTFPGSSVVFDMNLSAFGDQGGRADLAVLDGPLGWTIIPSITSADLRPGESILGTLTIGVTSETPTGQYSVLLRTAMEGAPLIQAFAMVEINVTDPWSDLVVSKPFLDPPKPSAGENVSINFTVSNTGHVVAEDFPVEVRYRYLNDGEEPSVLLYHEHVPTLWPGASVNISARWDASLGHHEFTVMADPLGSLPDLNPGDNLAMLDFVLEGYSVDLEATPLEVDTAPEEVEKFDLTVLNLGNLPDILMLKIVERPAGWELMLNSSSFILDPKETAFATLLAFVPSTVTGGTSFEIVLDLVSFQDPDKRTSVTLLLSIPEVFDLEVTQDSEGAEVAPLGTVWFNITLANMGNGFENYSLDYTHQTEDLLVTATNDTLELAPGCSTNVEVFVSSLGTPVGGQTFDLRFTVRSTDDPATVALVIYNVMVQRVFGIEVSLEKESYPALPGSTLEVTLSIINLANYPLPFEAVLLPHAVLFGVPNLPEVLVQDELTAGSGTSYDLYIPLNREIVMGTLTMRIRVGEIGSEVNVTLQEAEVEILQVDAPSFRVNSTTPDAHDRENSWTAELLVVNKGNHNETFVVNLSGNPGWMDVELSEREFVLMPYSQRLVVMTVGPIDREDKLPGNVMLAITATPANESGPVPTVIVDVPIEERSGGDVGSTWFLVLTLVLVLAVIVLTVALMRRER